MKVLHFHFGKYGGAENFFVQLVGALAQRGVQQKVIIRPKRRWRADIEPHAEVLAESNFRSASFDRLWLPLRVKRTMQKWQPDAVFAWMSRAGHLLPSNGSCKRFARLGDYPDRLSQFGNADTLICNTPGIARRVRELGWTRGVEVVTNFTCTDKVEPIPRSALRTPEDVPVICSAGRLVPRKGFDTLIRAVARMPKAYLWILGEGQEMGNLKSLATQLNVRQRVRFAGWQDDPRPYLAACDISAMASSHEALGNVILEGWAQKVPVVAARSEGPSWLVNHEQNGLLVDIGDDEGFAHQLTRLLEDQQLCRSLIDQGTHSLQTQFSEQSVVDRYLEVLFGAQRAQAA